MKSQVWEDRYIFEGRIATFDLFKTFQREILWPLSEGRCFPNFTVMRILIPHSVSAFYQSSLNILQNSIWAVKSSPEKSMTDKVRVPVEIDFSFQLTGSYHLWPTVRVKNEPVEKGACRRGRGVMRV